MAKARSKVSAKSVKGSGPFLFGRSLRVVFGVTLTLLTFVVMAKNGDRWGQNALRFFANKGGLRLEKLRIEGRQYTQHEALMKALEISKGEFLFQANLWKMRERVLALPWVKAVTIQRKVPDLLWIRLVEQYPIAHWQYKNQLFLIDDEGHVIQEPDNQEQGDLLIVTGENAPRATPPLMAALRSYPQIKQRVTGAMYIGNRRWDIILDTKMRVKLPEGNLEQGIEALKKLEENYVLNPQAILYIDVRYPHKAYIRYRPSFKPVSSSKSSKQA